MTPFINPGGFVITYTSEFSETILSQLNLSNNCYTSGEHAIIFNKIGSNKMLISDYTYFINLNIFQNCTINENIIKSYDLELMLNGTSNEYDLQSVYNGKGFIGIITELSQTYLAICDTDIIPFHLQVQEILTLQISRYR